MRTIYLDGQFFKVDDHIIEAFTPGAFNAKGVFETMLGLDGVVLDIALHMQRLRAGLKALKITAPPMDRSVLNKILMLNKLSSARVRLMVWSDGKQRHVMITALPYKTPAKKIYRVCLLKTQRPAQARFANVKSLDYGLFKEAYAKAQAQGFDEALLLNRRGHIFEASRANIFWVKDKVLYTPPLSSGCLNGITRQQIIRQARRLKIRVKEMNLTLPVLREADSAFLTNSLSGIKPIENKEIKIASKQG